MKSFDERGDCDHPGILNRLGMMYRDGHSDCGDNGKIVVGLTEALKHLLITLESKPHLV